MLDAAAYPALWALYDATGVRPEWLLPTLQIESGLDPSAANAQGYPYYGLNQIAGATLQSWGIDPSGYLSWPASQQISRAVGPYVASQIATYGPLRSGLKVYLANFYPAALRHADLYSDVVCKPARPCVVHDSDAYCANSALDVDHSGCITVSDLAALVQRAASSAAVENAIAAAYRLRSGIWPTNATYGLDYGGAASASMLGSPGHAVIAASVAAAAVYYAGPAWRWLRRALRSG